MRFKSENKTKAKTIVKQLKLLEIELLFLISKFQFDSLSSEKTKMLCIFNESVEFLHQIHA